MNPTYMILVYLVWFLATYFVVTLILVLIANRKNLYENIILKESAARPFVSIVVSAYNEEEKIEETLKSLKKIDYIVRTGLFRNSKINIFKKFWIKQAKKELVAMAIQI